MTNVEIKKIMPYLGENEYRKYHDKYQRYSEIWKKYAPAIYIGCCSKAFEMSHCTNYEDFYYWYIVHVKTPYEIINVAKLFYDDINDKSNTTLEECMRIVILHAVIETVDGKLKEIYLSNYLIKNGFEIYSPTQNDDSLKGIDIIAVKNNIKYLIQVKPISFFLGNKKDQIDDRINNFEKEQKALNAYPNSNYFVSIYNSRENKWLSADGKNLALKLNHLLYQDGNLNKQYWKSLVQIKI